LGVVLYRKRLSFRQKSRKFPGFRLRSARKFPVSLPPVLFDNGETTAVSPNPIPSRNCFPERKGFKIAVYLYIKAVAIHF
jgi:hypothetical protein